MAEDTKAAILGPMRIPFLLLNPACVLLGAASAVWSGSALPIGHLILTLVGALAAHIGVNALNEWEDFRTRLDFHTQRTPFSGGSGALPANPSKAPLALATAIIACAVTFAIGVYFLIVHGWGIVPLGILGLLAIATYTRWLTRNAFLCLIAPGVGFGTLMVMGTHFALTGSYSWTALLVSFVPFFLVADLLLLNQFPDAEPDRSIGRRHILITSGTKVGARVYGLFVILTYVTIVIGYLLRLLPLEGLLSLATILLAVPTVRGVLKHRDSIPQLVPYLGRNVILVLTTPILLAIGIFLGR